ncbi:hypothetical protein TNCV_3245611 [Trichonephila clavipes]|nr:hypothetical protein TNCV_3245611 [Trichonephila clavipes]
MPDDCNSLEQLGCRCKPGFIPLNRQFQNLQCIRRKDCPHRIPKVVSPKCLSRPPVDRDRLNFHPCSTLYFPLLNMKHQRLTIGETWSLYHSWSLTVLGRQTH